MSDVAYSPLKAAWHIDRIQDLRDKGDCVPVELQFILSDLCNHDCFFCAYRSEVGLSSSGFVEYDTKGVRNHNPNRMISKAKAFSILNDAVLIGIKSVIFTGGGEPTVHPDHLAIMRHALDLGLECSLNTNGALLRSGWEDILPYFKYIRFSIDAGCAEDYARIRRVPLSTYDRVLKHLWLVCDRVAELGTDCLVGTGYVITPDNYQYLLEGIKNIRKTGASYVRLASMQTTEGVEAAYAEVSWADVRLALQLAQKLNTATFTTVDVFSVTQGEKAGASMCGMQYFVVYVGANLKVYRCCYTAYTDLGEIGDLANQSFLEWFTSPERAGDLYLFDARSCATCPLEHKNRTIRYMAGTGPAPLHVNFI